MPDVAPPGGRISADAGRRYHHWSAAQQYVGTAAATQLLGVPLLLPSCGRTQRSSSTASLPETGHR